MHVHYASLSLLKMGQLHHGHQNQHIKIYQLSFKFNKHSHHSDYYSSHQIKQLRISFKLHLRNHRGRKCLNHLPYKY